MNSDDLIEEKFRLIPSQKKALKKLGIVSIHDLLFYFPIRYAKATTQKNIGSLTAGEHVTLYGRIRKLEKKKGFRSRIPMTKAFFEDATGKIRLVWFHQPYIAKMIQEGALIKITGKVASDKQGLYMANPETEGSSYSKMSHKDSLFEKNSTGEEDVSYQPIYSESRGITSRWMYYTLKKILARSVHEKIEDPIPHEILKKYHLPSLQSALIWIHAPQKNSDAEAARKRFAFEEIFFIQLERQRARREYQSNPSFKIESKKTEVDTFIKRFPFDLTSGQDKAIQTILTDFKKGVPMSRLLEGDVGSGKTAVAAVTAFATINAHPEGQAFGSLQTAIMAPTEILARQHFESFIEYFHHLPIQIGLITSSGCKKFPSKVDPTQATDISKTQLLKWVENGEIPILIGTHSLIQKTVNFKHLAYVIIDEQHRFGTKQRCLLTQKDTLKKGDPRVIKKERIPHLLSMTATPIPRTLALTIYGDLDLTLIDTMPKGRKPVLTEIASGAGRGGAYRRVRSELEAGRQVYIICPRIDEPDPTKERALNMKSVKEEAERLQKIVFPEYVIDILHSKMKPKEKAETMSRFSAGDINILVATSVVEVGVNVPNATTIIIEGAERFGLAQLHQLRGRVLRSTHQAYCFLVSESKSKHTQERIKTLITAKNGFELAEKDLLLRGPGELSGTKQWGISDLGMEAIKNIKMVEAARVEAQQILAHDPELKNYPAMKKRIKDSTKTHFE